MVISHSENVKHCLTLLKLFELAKYSKRCQNLFLERKLITLSLKRLPIHVYDKLRLI